MVTTGAQLLILNAAYRGAGCVQRVNPHAKSWIMAENCFNGALCNGQVLARLHGPETLNQSSSQSGAFLVQTQLAIGMLQQPRKSLDDLKCIL